MERRNLGLLRRRGGLAGMYRVVPLITTLFLKIGARLAEEWALIHELIWGMLIRFMIEMRLVLT